MMKATIQVFETIQFEHEIEVEIENEEIEDVIEDALCSSEMQCLDDVLFALRAAKIPVTLVCEGGGDLEDFEWYVS